MQGYIYSMDCKFVCNQRWLFCISTPGNHFRWCAALFLICSQLVYLHNSICYNQYSTANVENMEEDRPIILNKSVFLLAALYGRLVEITHRLESNGHGHD